MPLCIIGRIISPDWRSSRSIIPVIGIIVSIIGPVVIFGVVFIRGGTMRRRRIPSILGVGVGSIFVIWSRLWRRSPGRMGLPTAVRIILGEFSIDARSIFFVVPPSSRCRMIVAVISRIVIVVIVGRGGVVFGRIGVVVVVAAAAVVLIGGRLFFVGGGLAYGEECGCGVLAFVVVGRRGD